MPKAFPQGNRSQIIPIRNEAQNIEQGMSNGEVYEPFFEIKLHALRHSAVPVRYSTVQTSLAVMLIPYPVNGYLRSLPEFQAWFKVPGSRFTGEGKTDSCLLTVNQKL